MAKPAQIADPTVIFSAAPAAAKYKKNLIEPCIRGEKVNIL